MLFFAIFTIGYFLGVFTALAVFPPGVKEIEEQERDARAPIDLIDINPDLPQQAPSTNLTSLEISH